MSAQNEVAAEERPLAALFPGEAVLLSTGESVFVKPWGTKALLTEVPTKLGRFLAKIAPLAETFQGGNPVELVPAFIGSAGSELLGLVAWSVGLDEDKVGALSAGDFVKLTRTVVRLNQSFFVELSALADDLRQQLTKRG